jgi:Transcription factor WhiB
MTVHASWCEAAACRDADPELFFPVGTAGPALRQIEEAKRICRTCPAQAPCLAWWDGVCDLEFGRDGMPMYIEGPHDDTWRIMHTLRQNVGDGNFHYLVGLQS